MDLSNQETLIPFLGMDLVGMLFTGFFLYLFSHNENKDVGDKIAIAFFWFLEAVMFYFLLVPFYPPLLPLFEIIAKILLAFSFLFAGVGITIYGIKKGIIDRQIYVRGIYAPVENKGPFAIIWGIVIAFGGLLLNLLTLDVIAMISCSHSNIYCTVQNKLENVLNFVNQLFLLFPHQ